MLYICQSFRGPFVVLRQKNTDDSLRKLGSAFRKETHHLLEDEDRCQFIL